MNDLTTLRPPVLSDPHLIPGSFLPELHNVGRNIALVARLRACGVIRYDCEGGITAVQRPDLSSYPARKCA